MTNGDKRLVLTCYIINNKTEEGKTNISPASINNKTEEVKIISPEAKNNKTKKGPCPSHVGNGNTENKSMVIPWLTCMQH